MTLALVRDYNKMGGLVDDQHVLHVSKSVNHAFVAELLLELFVVKCGLPETECAYSADGDLEASDALVKALWRVITGQYKKAAAQPMPAMAALHEAVKKMQQRQAPPKEPQQPEAPAPEASGGDGRKDEEKPSEGAGAGAAGVADAAAAAAASVAAGGPGEKTWSVGDVAVLKANKDKEKYDGKKVEIVAVKGITAPRFRVKVLEGKAVGTDAEIKDNVLPAALSPVPEPLAPPVVAAAGAGGKRAAPSTAEEEESAKRQRAAAAARADALFKDLADIP